MGTFAIQAACGCISVEIWYNSTSCPSLCPFQKAPSVAWGRPSRSTKQRSQIRKSKEASKWRTPAGIGIAIVNHHVFALSPTVGRLASTFRSPNIA